MVEPAGRGCDRRIGRARARWRGREMVRRGWLALSLVAHAAALPPTCPRVQTARHGQHGQHGARPRRRPIPRRRLRYRRRHRPRGQALDAEQRMAAPDCRGSPSCQACEHALESANGGAERSAATRCGCRHSPASVAGRASKMRASRRGRRHQDSGHRELRLLRMAQHPPKSSSLSHVTSGPSGLNHKHSNWFRVLS
jgi:hypothetical protein